MYFFVCLFTEMRPKWFLHEDVPYSVMWPDDILWYYKMLSKQYFDASFKFEGHDTVLDYTITDRPIANSA